MTEIDIRFDNKIIPTQIYQDRTHFVLSFPYHKGLVEEIKETTECRTWQNANKTWKFEKTPRNLFVLDYLTGKDPYARYDSPLDENNISGLLTLAEQHTIKLWKHQKRMATQAIQRQCCIIGGEMRTGKTLPVLLTIWYLGIQGAWWVAPASALKGMKLEIKKWGFPNTIFLLTYDKFRRWWDKDIKEVPQFIVFDESQKLKNPKSIQGQKAREFRINQLELWGEDSYYIELSGTPAPKAPTDWWNQAECACPGFLREGSHTQLKLRLGEWEMREAEAGHKYPHLIKWKKDELELFYRRLDGLVEVFFKKDCLDLPDIERTTVTLTVPKSYYNAVRLIRKTTEGSLTLLNKLRQLSDGFLYINTPNEETAKNDRQTKYFPDCPKDKELKDDLDRMEDVGRLVVYCGFQATLDKVSKICLEKKWAVLKIGKGHWEVLNHIATPEEALKEMDGSVRPEDRKIEKLVVCAQADAASTGLELSATPLIAYFSNSYNGAARMQSEARAHSNNMDKTRGLEVKDYLHLPVDKLVRDNLLAKKTLQAITMGDINSIMKGFEL